MEGMLLAHGTDVSVHLGLHARLFPKGGSGCSEVLASRCPCCPQPERRLLRTWGRPAFIHLGIPQGVGHLIYSHTPPSLLPPNKGYKERGSFLPGHAKVLDAQLTARVSYAPNGFSQVKVLQAARANAIFRWDKVTVLLETVRFTIKPIDQSLELALRRDA